MKERLIGNDQGVPLDPLPAVAGVLVGFEEELEPAEEVTVEL